MAFRKYHAADSENLLEGWHAMARHTIFQAQEGIRLTMSLHAYFDESGKWHDGNGFICLCGYLSDDKGWGEFNDRWNELLQKHQFMFIHMTEFSSECHKRNWSQEKTAEVLVEFIDAIRTQMIAGFAIGIDGPYFRRKYELIGKPNADPALFAIERILGSMNDACKRWIGDRTARMFLMFDEDEEYSIQCYRKISRLRKIRPDVKKLIGAIAFGDDEYLSPLQAADILANLTTRYMREKIKTGKDEMGALLTRLLSAPEPGYGIMWKPELWDAAGIDANWDQLKRVNLW